MTQTTLLPSPPPSQAARRSSKGIGPGDIVEVDKKGRRFHALVIELDQVESGRFHLNVRPLDSRVSYQEMAQRGRDTLRFGPLKPVGLRDPQPGLRLCLRSYSTFSSAQPNR